jgi:hypothetical protein
MKSQKKCAPKFNGASKHLSTFSQYCSHFIAFSSYFFLLLAQLPCHSPLYLKHHICTLLFSNKRLSTLSCCYQYRKSNFLHLHSVNLCWRKKIASPFCIALLLRNISSILKSIVPWHTFTFTFCTYGCKSAREFFFLKPSKLNLFLFL